MSVANPSGKPLTIYVLSDSTGQTAETIAKAVLRQFRQVHQIEYVRLPRITNDLQLTKIVEIISSEQPCLIAYTLSVPHLKSILEKVTKEFDIKSIDLLSPLVKGISDMIGLNPSNHENGMLRKMDAEYFKRMEAIEFAIKFDDGKDPKGIMRADVILIGVSRTSKTPTCMYLAQNHGIKAGNIPIVQNHPLPPKLYSLPRGRVIGLKIEPKILHIIRTARLKSLGLPSTANYANYDQIVDEIKYASRLMAELRCPIVDVSHRSVEETTYEIFQLRYPRPLKGKGPIS